MRRTGLMATVAATVVAIVPSGSRVPQGWRPVGTGVIDGRSVNPRTFQVGR